MNNVFAIIDMQYGSTGKGLFAHMLATHIEPDTCVHAFAPNAGHTVILENGAKYVFTMVASSFITPKCRVMLIGPGAVVNVESLAAELALASDMLTYKTVIIHPRAMVVNDRHREEEKANVTIGSTMKGSGAALVEKIKRGGTPITAADCEKEILVALRNTIPRDAHMHYFVNEAMYEDALDDSRTLFVEGAQGHSLSIHSNFYPHTTSRDVSVHQLFADCRLPRPRYPNNVHIYGTARTYPIRVANRFDIGGKQIGSSGGHYPDQEEIAWKDLDLEPELTTVTKLPRRVFTLSIQQLRDAIRLNRPRSLFLNFCNYVDTRKPVEHQGMSHKLRMVISNIEGATGVRVQYVGFGPKASDVWENHDGILRPVSRGTMPDTMRIGE